MNSNRPDLSNLNQELASDSARTDHLVGDLLARIDGMLEAAVNEDWDEVQRQTGEIASGGLAHGLTEIAESARRVCEALEDRGNTARLNLSIRHLANRCQAARKPDK